MGIKDYDSMKYRKFTTKSEMDKSFHTLIGIINGITLDVNVNEYEVEELVNWCNLHKHLIKKHPYNEIIPLLEKCLEDNIITKEEVEDIWWLCDQISGKSEYYDVITSDLQVLQGMLHGILADNKISEIELEQLKFWLDDNKQLSSMYPYDEIYSIVTSVLRDGKIDADEHKILKVFFSEFVDLKESYNINQNEINELKESVMIQGICSICPEITVKDNVFCFTGASSKTKRSEIANIIESNGGKFSSSVTKNTKYLVIGDEGNPCWAFSCYGRKVEKAIELRRNGQQILIVHENDFWNSIKEIS